MYLNKCDEKNVGFLNRRHRSSSPIYKVSSLRDATRVRLNHAVLTFK